jgi:hypothetical protein
MSTQRLSTYGGLTLNTADIKCIKWPTLNSSDNAYIVKIELKTRYDYILHPETATWEKQSFHDVVVIRFGRIEQALDFCLGWEEVWEDTEGVYTGNPFMHSSGKHTE